MQRSEYVQEMLGESVAQAERLDSHHKLLLAVVGTLTIIVLLAAALKENVFADWRHHQRRFGAILREKATDEWGRKLADDYKVEMQQIVVPKLDVVDRCVSCHRGIDDPRMTDVRQPYAVHPGEHLNWHDPNEFGCTICHRGQGRAMVFAEAKAEGYHWDYPMLPVEYTQSSCGMCHSGDEVAERGGEVYALGEKLYGDKGCASCHKLAGRGGGLGPALDRTGWKIAGELPMTQVTGPHTLPQWLKEHFDDPQIIAQGSQMPPSQLSEAENVALTTFTLSLQDRDLPSAYIEPGKLMAMYERTHPVAASGEELFGRYCAVCHDTGEYGRYDRFFKRFMPAVRGHTYVRVASEDYVKQTVQRGRAGTLMFGWDEAAGGLTGDEIQAIADYLREPAQSAPDVSGVPPDVISMAHDPEQKVTGDAAHGQVIFGKHCVGCHGASGNGLLGPALSNPGFQAAATDGLIYATIAYGRVGTAMPAFLGEGAGGFAQTDIEALVSHVRTLAGQAAPVAEGAAKGKAAQNG